MAYGTVKVDNVTFTYNSADATTTFSGFYASTTNNLTLSGTASAATFTGTTANFTNTNAQNISVTTLLSGLAITGGTAGFTIVTGTTVTGTTANFVTVSGTTVTGTTAQFTSITGGTAGFTTITGTTVTGTTANFVTVSGTTVTGTTASFTSGIFTSLSGTTHTITSGVFALGTAALPSISFVSDPNTGIYSPGADQVAVATNGTQRITIDSSGRFLVGTSSNDSNFDSKLQIAAGDATASSLLTRFSANSGGPVIYFGKSRSASVGTKSLVSDGDTLGGLEFYGSGAANWQLSAKIEAQVDGTPESGGDTSDMPGRLVFSTTADGGSSPSERLRITSAGLVGIGTSSPAALLHLSATAGNQELRFSDTTNSAMGRIYENNGLVIISETNHGISFQTSATARGGFEAGGNFFIDTNTLYVDATNNRVGIGVTSPGTELQISATTPTIRLEENGAGSKRLELSVNSSAEAKVFATQSGSELLFGTVGTERARIDSSGRLLVGTTTTSSTATIIAQGSNGGAAAPGVFRACHKTTPANDELFAYYLFGDSTHCDAAYIAAARDGGTWTSGTSHPTRLVFSTTADGASSPTERLRITSAGVLQIADAGNITVGTTTGTKIGTATTQKLGFYNATPVVQPAAVADATDAATVITQLNDLLAKLRTLGIIAT